jgi:hypothetical protein
MRDVDKSVFSWYVLYVSSVRKNYSSPGLRADQFSRGAHGARGEATREICWGPYELV